MREPRDRDHWGSMIPGRVITAEALAAQSLTPAILLKKDFGIAAIKYHHPLSEAAQDELDQLHPNDLDRLEASRLHFNGERMMYLPYGSGSLNPFYMNTNHIQKLHEQTKAATPPTLLAEADSCLRHFFERFGGRRVFGEFWTKQVDFSPHFDTSLTGHWHLSRHHGMRVYSATQGRLNIVSNSEDVDRDQLDALVARGHATYDDLVSGDLYHFNDRCVHESTVNPPRAARPVRFIMKSIP